MRGWISSKVLIPLKTFMLTELLEPLEAFIVTSHGSSRVDTYEPMNIVLRSPLAEVATCLMWVKGPA